MPRLGICQKCNAVIKIDKSCPWCAIRAKNMEGVYKVLSHDKKTGTGVCEV